MAQLLDLPVEVVESSILPHLSWSDLLRCRRVCTSIKKIAEDFIRINPELAPEIEISEKKTEQSLQAYINLGITTTKLFINNPSGYNFFDNLDPTTLNHFVNSHGPMIESLRLKELSLCPCSNEWTFLSSLSTLRTLEAGVIGYGETSYQKHVLRAQYDPRTAAGPFLPENLNETLELLKIGSTHPMAYKIRRIQDRLSPILRVSKKLDYISFPVNLHYGDDGVYVPPKANPHQGERVLVQMMTQLSNYLVTSSRNGRKHLKFIDFENYHLDKYFRTHYVHTRTSPSFLVFCKQCVKMDVKLLNVHPMWFQERLKMYDEGLRSAQLGNAVLSLVNLDACVFALDMPNLEKIDIRQISPAGYSMSARRRLPEWPSLKILNVNVDKGSELKEQPEELLWLLGFLFKDVLRWELTELSLSFETKLGKLVPKTGDIVKSCPNLKKLKIYNWPGTNKALTKLWKGLLALEEVTLENCEGLGNVAFVGEDVGNPVFLKLKNLKKLSLKGLDQMPKITDTLFSLVLARMNLTDLVLTSEKPLIKITKLGICALLKGTEFTKSIEKFPFYGWSLADLPAQGFQKLGKQFRSSRMM